MIDFYQKLAELIKEDIPCATAVITRATGSIPNEVGAMLIADGEGKLITGTVGGGEIERRTLIECKEAISEAKHRFFNYHLSDKEAGGIGMLCGGNADIYVHVHGQKPQLLLLGAGHVNIELARFAHQFGWSVTVVDDREEWCNKEHFPHAKRIIAEVEDVGDQINWSDQSTYVVIATRDHDDRGLRLVVDKAIHYVGMVASKRKVIIMVRKLAEEGIDVKALVEKLRSPIGLDVGGRGPADVALSIIAQLQAIRHGKSGASLALSAEKILA